MKKILLLFLSSVFMLAACGGEEKQEVQMSIDPSLDNDTVTLDIETNIDERAILHYDVMGDDVDDFETGEFEITGQSFTQELDMSSFNNSSNAEMIISFVPSLQDEELQEIYGSEGENIATDSSYFHQQEIEDGYRYTLKAEYELTLE